MKKKESLDSITTTKTFFCVDTKSSLAYLFSLIYCSASNRVKYCQVSVKVTSLLCFQTSYTSVAKEASAVFAILAVFLSVFHSSCPPWDHSLKDSSKKGGTGGGGERVAMILQTSRLVWASYLVQGRLQREDEPAIANSPTYKKT